MRAFVAVCLGAAVLAPACRNAGPRTTAPIRLVDLYRPDPATAAREAGSAPAAPASQWRFTLAAVTVAAPARPGLAGARPAPPPWAAGPGVADLKAENGLLVGRTTAAFPILHLRRPRSDDRDVVHEVQVRVRASAGANLSVMFRSTEEVDLAWEVDNAFIIPWSLSSPIVAGEMRTYSLRPTGSIPMASRHVLVRPTDAAGASFEIEWVRVVSRREHLAGIRAGMRSTAGSWSTIPGGRRHAPTSCSTARRTPWTRRTWPASTPRSSRASRRSCRPGASARSR